MEWQEMLRQMRWEYHGNMAATCQCDPPFLGMLDQEKVDQFPSFYDFLLQRGFSRFELSARGVGCDIEA